MQIKQVPLILIQSEDLLSVNEPYCIILHKNIPVAIKDGNIIVLRSDSFSFLDYIIDFLKTLKNRLEVLQDIHKSTRIAFKLHTKKGKIYYICLGRLNFFEYRYLYAKLQQLGIIPSTKNEKAFAKFTEEKEKEVLQWLYSF